MSRLRLSTALLPLVMLLLATIANARIFTPGFNVFSLDDKDAKSTSIAFSADGKYMAWAQSGNSGGRCSVAFQDGETTSSFSVAWINRWGGFVTFSPDSRFLVVTSPGSNRERSMVKVLSLKEIFAEHVTPVNANEKPYVINHAPRVLWKSDYADWSVSQTVVTSDSRFVIGACSDKTIRVWNAATGELQHTLPVGGVIKGLVFSASTRELIVAVGYAPRGTLQFWNLAQARLTRKISAHDSVETVLCANGGKTLVTSNNRGVVTFWDTRKGTTTRSVKMEKSATRLKDVTPDGSLLAGLAKRTKGPGYVVTHWNAQTGKIEGQYLTSSYGENRPVTFFPAEKRIAAGGFGVESSEVPYPVITVSHLILK